MALKLKIRTQFPASVTASSPLTMSKTGLAYTFGVDINALSSAINNLNPDLTAIEALTGTGLLARTSPGIWAQRTVTGTANEITLTNGDGVAGNPTASLPSALTFTGKTVTGGTFNTPTFVTPVLGAATGTSLKVGPTDLLASVTNKIEASSSTAISALAVGQSAANNLNILWNWNATPASATAAIGTFGYSNPLNIDASTLTLQGLSGGALTLNNNGAAPTGTGAYVRATSPVFVSPNLGAAAATSINAVSIAAGQITGEPSTGSATAGNIGEYVSSSVASGSAVSLTTNTQANLTSISLPSGDWDVWFECNFIFVAGTSVTVLDSSISQTTAVLDQTPGNISYYVTPAFVPGTGQSLTVNCGPSRKSLASTTTIFGVAFATFTVAGCSAWGTLRARRVR